MEECNCMFFYVQTEYKLRHPEMDTCLGQDLQENCAFLDMLHGISTGSNGLPGETEWSPGVQLLSENKLCVSTGCK